MAEQYNPVDFSTLSAVDDGKTLLYTDDKVCRSISSLGELINDKIGEKGYATETFVENEIGKVGNFIVTSGDDDGPYLDAEEAQTKSIYLIESGSGKDKYREWIATGEVGSKTWTCIGDTTLDLSDYAKTTYVNNGLALKEDKLTFAGENNTITAINTSAVGGGTSITGEQNHSIAYLESTNSEPRWEQLGEEEITVTTPDETEGTVELNGRTYKTIAIGNQIWLAENYVDSDSGKFDTNHPEYGEYFSKNFDITVPEGWHIPTKEEWVTMINYVKNKYGHSDDNVSELFANGSTKLNLLYAGCCLSNYNSFLFQGTECYFWTSTFDDSANIKKCVKFEEGWYWPNYDILQNNNVWWINIRLVKDSNTTIKKYIKSFTDLEFMAKSDSNGDVINETYATKNELNSAKSELVTSIASKQDAFIVGTDLKFNNNTLSINTDGVINNSADMSFVAGSGTTAKGLGTVAAGIKTKASSSGAFACEIGRAHV